MAKKVLIVTYYWPPSGGPGVQRALKFAKYLPQFGWEPIILTIKDGEYPAIDESLEKDIPEECMVYKTKAIEPNFLYKKFTGMKKDDKIPVANLAQKDLSWKKKLSNWVRLNLFIPDAKIGWIPYAVAEGKKIIEQEKPDVIFSTSPPPTVHLIAKKLAKWSGIKWVADFRDPWTNIHYLQHQKINFLSKKYNKKLETEVVATCNKAICVSANFIDLITDDKKEKFSVITNGFDEELDPIQTTRIKNSKFTILYIGGLTWNRYFNTFFVELKDLLIQGKLDRNKVTLKFAGSIAPEIQEELEELFKDLGIAEFHGYIPHTEAVKQMYTADLLLLFLEQVKGYEGHIPGKLFEYLSTGNQVLGIGNTSGESAKILRGTNSGDIFKPEEKTAIRTQILKVYSQWAIDAKPTNNTSLIETYSRKELTKQLAKQLNDML